MKHLATCLAICIAVLAAGILTRHAAVVAGASIGASLCAIGAIASRRERR
jgi:hypothetical protein